MTDLNCTANELAGIFEIIIHIIKLETTLYQHGKYLKRA